MDEIKFESLNGKPASFSDYVQRVAHVKSILVMHPKFAEALSELEEIHELSKHSVMTDQLCILGPTGAGKTTMVEQYASKFPRILERERTVIPILNVKVPPRARSPKVLASKILRVMQDPMFNAGTEENMTNRIQYFVKACDIQMIILDEFQHLIDRETDHVLANASDWLKTFIEEVNIPVVLCGLPVSERIFEHNEQLDGRYPNRILLPPFAFSTNEEIIEFRKFIVSIDKQLPFYKLSHLSDPDIAAKIYYFSFGVPRYIMDLLKQATKYALKKGNDQITQIELRDSFDKITRSIRPYAINPFEQKNFDLMDEIEKERKLQGNLFKTSTPNRRSRKR
ncbi:putative AAA+ superfamily ATPase [Paenibacillus sp. PastF-3]|uniref:TniB family NTP-binding protein n=1 Tax=Paenibacillus sp. PastF-3 TaxID=2940626 RepID=UPI00247553A7|nr:TniB family NTP-binding protein [Paenibacillus sp. PastF-3]MDH6374324.1 putative AAA+ superfamily ATPase [Paenibacillus sp. PastF-3]